MKQSGLNRNSPKLIAFGYGDLVSLAPPPAVIPVAPVAYHHMSNFAQPRCRPDVTRDGDIARLREHRKELHGTDQSRQMIALHAKLSRACNVSSAQDSTRSTVPNSIWIDSKPLRRMGL